MGGHGRRELDAAEFPRRIGDMSPGISQPDIRGVIASLETELTPVVDRTDLDIRRLPDFRRASEQFPLIVFISPDRSLGTKGKSVAGRIIDVFKVGSDEIRPETRISGSGFAAGIDPVFIVTGIKGQTASDGLELRMTGDGFCPLPCRIQRRQQHRGENRDDGDNDKQFDQREFPVMSSRTEHGRCLEPDRFVVKAVHDPFLLLLVGMKII